jgi:hypothetical protein
MSFADFTISILSALSTVTTVPTPNPIFTGDCATAFGETVSGVSRPALLDRAQRDIGSHELGDGGGIPRLAGVLGIENLAVLGFDHEQRFGPRAGRRE